MKSNSRQALPNCPKCQSQDTTKNGTVPSKLGRVQRLRCNNCKHIWNVETFPLTPNDAARASQSRKSQNLTGLSSKKSSIPSSVAGSASSSVQQTTHLERQAPVVLSLHHRHLELDIPLDWSPTGLLDFARDAQHKLVQAALPFGQPGVAELEWNALNPDLKAYIRARQHLDVALLLQLSAVFGTPNAFGSAFAGSTFLQPASDQPQMSPQMLEAHTPTASYRSKPKQQTTKAAKHASSRVKPIQSQKRTRQPSLVTASKTDTDSPTEISSTNSSSVKSADDPERTQFLETLNAFHEERQLWMQERELLRQNVRELGEDQSRNTLRLTSVTHEFERLKKKVFEQPPTAKTITTQEAKPSSTFSKDVPRETTTLKSADSSAISLPSSSFRTLPPKYTAREEANLERLANSLMANLVRLDGHSIRPRDLPHVTGEQGPWKAVIDHLMTLGDRKSVV